MKILLIEDEAGLAQDIQSYLDREAVRCEWAADLESALDKLAAFDYDIVVLDLMLPDGSGLEALRSLKARGQTAGVLIISAKNALDDKLSGFELGADDYLTKPFHLPELNARLKALFRRQQFAGEALIQFGDLVIHPEERSAKVGQQPLDLTPKEFDLLVYFLANKNRVLTKQAIAEHLWGDYVDGLDHFDFVYQHIKNLRKKLAEAGMAAPISTVYGLGYKFDTHQA